jgi:hypothetical protein
MGNTGRIPDFPVWIRLAISPSVKTDVLAI